MLDAEGIRAELGQLKERVERLTSERDEYKKLYVALLESFRRLEAGLVRHQRERFEGGNREQLVLSVVEMLVGQQPAAPDAQTQQVEAHERRKPTGRKALPESLPRIEIEVTPPEVQRRGLDAFERIGEEVSETIERRPASAVVVRTVRPKYVAKEEADPQLPKVLQAPAPELPIPRAIAGPAMLADSVVRRFQDHLPLYRLERIYAREGLPLARSTICGWHQEVASLTRPLVMAMWKDALTRPYLCMDATGVLVQAPKKCRNGHFFVTVAPERHVLFGYTPKHDAAAVDKLIGTYKGTLVADAHSVYEHLYRTGDVVESACWGHSRRYWVRALDSDRTRAEHGLSLIQGLFILERKWEHLSTEERLRLRQEKAKPIVDTFFAYCDQESLKVLDETPISKAIGYARNQRAALERFLTDGRLPIHNNWSENALRREACGRKNWLFLGNDRGGEVNATLVTLLASCQMHGLEPLGYLRDLLCLLPSWPVQKVLELAPVNWPSTMVRADVQQTLGDNIFRQVALGIIKPQATSPPGSPSDSKLPEAPAALEPPRSPTAEPIRAPSTRGWWIALGIAGLAALGIALALALLR